MVSTFVVEISRRECTISSYISLSRNPDRMLMLSESIDFDKEISTSNL